MRLVTFDAGAGPVLGGLIGEEVVALRPALAAAMRAAGEADTAAAAIPADMVALIADDAAMVAAGRALAFAARAENMALRAPVGSVRLLAPLRPGKILGIGRNYGDHAKEVGGPKLELPRIFLKPASSVVGPGAAIRIPPAVKKPDWEAELGVVIGRRCSNVAPDEAAQCIFGYTCVNDVTAIEIIGRDDLCGRAERLGDWLRERLNGVKSRFPDKIAEVRVHGLMIGIELTRPGAEVWKALLEKGFILNLTQDTVLRLLPPLIITQEELEAFVATLESILAHS